MKNHDLYMKVVFTLVALCIFIGISIILFCKSFVVGFCSELLALLILFIVAIWDS